MKKLIFFLILFSFCSFHNLSAVNIPVYGKAGSVVNGELKLCPGWGFFKCATITLTWQDIKEWFSDGIGSQPGGVVTLYDDQGVETGSYAISIITINPILITDQPPSQIQGDDIKVK